MPVSNANRRHALASDLIDQTPAFAHELAHLLAPRNGFSRVTAVLKRVLVALGRSAPPSTAVHPAPVLPSNYWRLARIPAPGFRTAWACKDHSQLLLLPRVASQTPLFRAVLLGRLLRQWLARLDERGHVQRSPSAAPCHGDDQAPPQASCKFSIACSPSSDSRALLQTTALRSSLDESIPSPRYACPTFAPPACLPFRREG